MLATHFTQENGKPTEEFAALLDTCEVRHDGSFESVYAATQQAWLQPAKTRADILETHGDLRSQVMELLRALGLVDAIHGSNPDVLETPYEYAGVLGAKVVGVRKRLRFALNEHWAGARFNRLCLAGSPRPLPPEEQAQTLQWNNPELGYRENLMQGLPTPETEIGMMQFVYDLAQRSGTLDFKIPCFAVSCPPNAKHRYTTHDNMQAFREEVQPKPGARILVISSQPYVSFQALVAAQELSEATVVGCGYEAPATTKISQYLDNIAKFLHELRLTEK